MPISYEEATAFVEYIKKKNEIKQRAIAQKAVAAANPFSSSTHIEELDKLIAEAAISEEEESRYQVCLSILARTKPKERADRLLEEAEENRAKTFTDAERLIAKRIIDKQIEGIITADEKLARGDQDEAHNFIFRFCLFKAVEETLKRELSESYDPPPKFIAQLKLLQSIPLIDDWYTPATVAALKAVNPSSASSLSETRVAGAAAGGAGASANDVAAAGPSGARAAVGAAAAPTGPTTLQLREGGTATATRTASGRLIITITGRGAMGEPAPVSSGEVAARSGNASGDGVVAPASAHVPAVASATPAIVPGVTTFRPPLSAVPSAVTAEPRTTGGDSESSNEGTLCCLIV